MKQNFVSGILMFIILMPISLVSAEDVLPSKDATVTTLQEILVTSVGNPQAAGVLQVTSSDKQWTVVTGQADYQTRTPVTSIDRFRIGSVGKTFTAVVVLKLVEEGLFNLDDPIHKWLPADLVSKLANADTATIRQLLAMRSGIPEYLQQPFIDQVLKDTSHIWSPEEALTYAYDKLAPFSAGTAFDYSNTNYILLQLIVERTVNEPLSSLVRDLILTPLHLTRTYTQVYEDQPGGFVDALGHWGPDHSLIEVTDYSDGAGLGDGGLVSTADDLTVFFLALLKDKTLLSETSLKAMTDMQPMDEDGELFGLGLQKYQTPYGVAYGRHGSVMGFFVAAVYLPDHDLSVTALYAIDNPDIFDAMMKAAAVVISR